MKNELQLEWLLFVSKEQNKFILKEYRYLVHRFAMWMGLTISKTENEIVRQLILPNFVEESGTIEGVKSHLKMFDDLLESVGINVLENYTPSKMTKEVENNFFTIFDNFNTYKALCVLGPSTEAISHQFLIPLQEITLKNFPNADKEYLDIHLSEVEKEHAIAIEKAIENMEQTEKNLSKNKQEYIDIGFNLHKTFWDNLKVEIIKSTNR